MTSRRSLFATISAGIATITARQVTRAQRQTQEIVNDMQVVSTGDVHLGQRAAGSQLVYVDQKGNRYYALETVQVVENNGQVVATGDVWVEQEAAGEQDITLAQVEGGCTGPCDYGLSEIETGFIISCHELDNCIAGQVMSVDPQGPLAGKGFLIQGADCCWRFVGICGTCH